MQFIEVLMMFDQVLNSKMVYLSQIDANCMQPKDEEVIMKKVLFAATLALMVLFSSMAMAETEIILAISAAPGSTQYITAEEFTRRANDRQRST